MNKLLEDISKYVHLSDALKEELGHRIVVKAFKKGDIIHDASRVCRHSYFIEEGILRLFFIQDGEEISEYFCGSNKWMNSPRSFMEQKIDYYYIDAIEDTNLVSLSVDDIIYLFDTFPEMEKYARIDMASTFNRLLDRITSMRSTTAKEKYDHFCETYPHIHYKIPLKMVASYLGITQETLSRIRSKK